MQGLTRRTMLVVRPFITHGGYGLGDSMEVIPRARVGRHDH